MIMIQLINKMSQNSALKLLLQKQITSQQYKIIDEYKQVADTLQREQERNKSNSARLQELQQKVSCLELMNSTSVRESMRYQRKLQKLESTQTYATHLLKLKYQSFMQLQQHHSRKHEQCATSRERMIENRKLAQSVYDRRKSQRIRKIREEEGRVSMDLRRRSSELQALVRLRKEQVRQHQLRLKDRKRRYQMFKMQRAASNYNQKLQQEVLRFKQQSQHLQQLNHKVRRQQQLFRKTQILSKQAAKIESLYLTGTDH